MSYKCKGLCTCVSKELGEGQFLRNSVGKPQRVQGSGELRCACRGDEGREIFMSKGGDDLRPSLLTKL